MSSADAAGAERPRGSLGACIMYSVTIGQDSGQVKVGKCGNAAYRKYSGEIPDCFKKRGCLGWNRRQRPWRSVCVWAAACLRLFLCAALTVSAQDEPFVDQVSDVIDQIDQYVAELLAIRDVLQPLEALRPDDADGFDLR